MTQHRYLTPRLSLLAFVGLVPLACNLDGIGIDDVGVGGSPGDYSDDVSGGGADPGTGGATTGGASSCEGTRAPAQTFACAGGVYEQEVLGDVWTTLETQSGWYACGGYDDYYGDDGGYDYPSTGGASSTGGAVGWPGGASGDDGSMGGEGGVWGTGGWGTGGITGVGGSWPGPNPTSDWCNDLEGNDTIAGVSYRFGGCRDVDLKLPVRFEEPQGWYQLRVFAGESACERGTLVAETSGYGLGRVVEVPVDVAGEVFVSLELTTQGNWTSGRAELNSLPSDPVD